MKTEDKKCPFCGAGPDQEKPEAYWACGTMLCLPLKHHFRAGRCYETQISQLQVKYLTAEEVLKMCDEYCEKQGNPCVAKAVHLGYERTGEVARAALTTFGLEKVVVYKAKQKKG